MFKKLKYRIRRNKLIVVEILETLVIICLYLYHQNAYRNQFSQYMLGHADDLKHYSKQLKEEILKDELKRN